MADTDDCGVDAVAATSAEWEQAFGNGDETVSYHPLSAVGKGEFADGYVGHLTAEQDVALAELKTRILSLKLDLTPHIIPKVETFDMFCLRFLRARKFDVKKAEDMLLAMLVWYESERIFELGSLRAIDLVGADNMALLKENLPSYSYGHDKIGRPVIYKVYGRCDIGKMIDGGISMELLVRHHIWMTETSLRRLRSSSLSSGHSFEDFVVVVDLDGWSLSRASSRAYAYLKTIAEVDSNNYPERLGQCIVVNAPFMFSVAWKIVRAWLDPKTRRKVSILRGKSEIMEALRPLIDEEFIPADFGGKGPLLSSLEDEN